MVAMMKVNTLCLSVVAKSFYLVDQIYIGENGQ